MKINWETVITGTLVGVGLFGVLPWFVASIWKMLIIAPTIPVWAR